MSGEDKEGVHRSPVVARIPFPIRRQMLLTSHDCLTGCIYPASLSSHAVLAIYKAATCEDRAFRPRLLPCACLTNHRSRSLVI